MMEHIATRDPRYDLWEITTTQPVWKSIVKFRHKSFTNNQIRIHMDGLFALLALKDPLHNPNDDREILRHIERFEVIDSISELKDLVSLEILPVIGDVTIDTWLVPPGVYDREWVENGFMIDYVLPRLFKPTGDEWFAWLLFFEELIQRSAAFCSMASLHPESRKQLIRVSNQMHILAKFFFENSAIEIEMVVSTTLGDLYNYLFKANLLPEPNILKSHAEVLDTIVANIGELEKN